MAALEAVDQVEGLVFEGKFDEACGHMRMICIPLAVSCVPVCVRVRLAPSLVGFAITRERELDSESFFSLGQVRTRSVKPSCKQPRGLP